VENRALVGDQAQGIRVSGYGKKGLMGDSAGGGEGQEVSAMTMRLEGENGGKRQKKPMHKCKTEENLHPIKQGSEEPWVRRGAGVVKCDPKREAQEPGSNSEKKRQAAR